MANVTWPDDWGQVPTSDIAFINNNSNAQIAIACMCDMCSDYDDLKNWPANEGKIDGPGCQAASNITKACEDIPGWTDSEGFSCHKYVADQWCTPSGGYGAGWESTWGDFDKYMNASHTAVSACCGCGGGATGGRTQARRM